MYGVIDIGSNTIRLAVYDIRQGRPVQMFNKKIVAGLSGYVTAGRMTEEGVRRAVDAIGELLSLAKTVGLARVDLFATAALRNVHNSREAVAEIERAVGAEIRVLSGEEEARLDYAGAILEYPLDSGTIIDVGGGSTELVFFCGGKILQAGSFPVGCLTLHRDFVDKIVPSGKEMAAMRRYIADVFREISVPAGIPSSVVIGVGGSARASEKLMREEFGQRVVVERCFHTEDLREYLERYRCRRHAHIDQILKVVPERIHTVIPGMLILEALAEFLAIRHIETSDCGVREGFLLDLLAQEKMGVKR